MKRALLVLLVVVAIGFLALKGRSQTPDVSEEDAGLIPQAAHPEIKLTKLDKALRLSTNVVSRAYSDMGMIRADDGSAIRVLAVEVSDLNTKDVQSGICVQVQSKTGRLAETYVDSEKIAALLSAIDQVRQIQRSSNVLTSFDARYRTEAGLEVNNIEQQGARAAEIRCVQVRPLLGDIIWSRSLLRPSRLDEFKTLISTAKDKLDQSSRDRTDKHY